MKIKLQCIYNVKYLVPSEEFGDYIMNKKIKGKSVIFVLIVSYVCYIFVSQQITMRNIKNQIADKKIEEQKAKEKNRKLQDEVKMSKSDMYIEKLARERLGLIKKGETPVIDTKN